jgi:outer membrane biosynthesis protein TonB
VGSSIKLLFILLLVVSGCASGPMGSRNPHTKGNSISFSFGLNGEGSSESPVAEGLTLGAMAWEYGPWEKQFIRKLRSHWTAPYAYRAGDISGATTVNILVGKNGVFRNVDCRERKGDDCLHEASVRALKAMSGQVPLPSEFLGDELLVTVNLKYPELKE